MADDLHVTPETELVFFGIRVADAFFGNFPVPVGSEPRPCHTCREPTFVQRSSLELIAKHPKNKHMVVCYVCFRKIPLDVRRKMAESDRAKLVPECKAEFDMLEKKGKKWWENR